jgi:phosphatidylglycerophosphatase A
MSSRSSDENHSSVPVPQSTGRRASGTFVDHSVLLLATGFGVGRVRVAPGTFGSLWGPPLVWGLQEAGAAGWAWGASTAILVLLGVPICGRAATILGRKDPGSVVYDEIAAFPVVFAFTQVDWLTALMGFGSFRLYDIWKPWPVRRFEQLPGGWGIMADDLVAGVYAAATMWLTCHFLR